MTTNAELYHQLRKIQEEINDLFGDLLYKTNKSTKREETPQEKEARLLREKAQLREAKIDKLLSDDKKSL